MRFLLLLFLFLGTAVFAQDVRDCGRPQPDDLYEYKENYIPIEFDHEPFGFEIADLLLLCVAMSIAVWFSLKQKPSKWITVTMWLGLAYFGLYRGGCICPVGATTNFIIGMAAPELIGKAVAVLFLLPLIFAFFFGRIFCSSACPLGALQHVLSRKKGIQLSKRFNGMMQVLPLLLLGATAWGALRGGLFIACKLDVYKIVFYSGYAWIDQFLLLLQGALVEPRVLLVGDVMAWTLLVMSLILGWFVPRPFCRFLCPYSVLLGIFSKLGLRRRRILHESCVDCGQCEKTCPVQAISSVDDQLRISQFHCIQCGRCDDVCRKDSIKG